MDYFPQYMGCHPEPIDSYFLRWLLHHQPGEIPIETAWFYTQVDMQLAIGPLNFGIDRILIDGAGVQDGQVRVMRCLESG
jgi:hypothetical protein